MGGKIRRRDRHQRHLEATQGSAGLLGLIEATQVGAWPLEKQERCHIAVDMVVAELIEDGMEC